MNVQISGGFSMLIFLCFTTLVCVRQLHINRTLWTSEYTSRYIQKKMEQGTHALLCAFISLIMYMLEQTTLISLPTKLLWSRILLPTFIVFMMFLFNAILHASRYLAICVRLQHEDMPDRSLLKYSNAWRIPKFVKLPKHSSGNQEHDDDSQAITIRYPGIIPRRKSKSEATTPLITHNLKEHQAATASAIRTIETTWFAIFMLIPSLEYSIVHQQFCIFVGILRIT